ncbi:type II toxin-antitoxin system RelE/ParE family toxin [Microcoleus sp. CAWBG58]|uniref:type II toxin-antitoxin system RelE/ParE family toxin n=1 Tax=Microcoleus sp. CAWBG58 TaxID=2841651 RepID=UPI0025D7298E|nr:type II toxin-antitoxin system RelE/ParE family toxin [Microcoleus sp. CAWBG58]
MAGYILAPSAKRDMKEIAGYIAQFNPDSARRLTQAIKQQCKLLANFPNMGRNQDDFEPGLQSFPVENYLIFYRAVGEGVEIVRVLSGYQDLEAIFYGDEGN